MGTFEHTLLQQSVQLLVKTLPSIIRWLRVRKVAARLFSACRLTRTRGSSGLETRFRGLDTDADQDYPVSPTTTSCQAYGC